jgi:hypothetical protein
LLRLHSLEGRVFVMAGGQSIERPGWFSSRWDVESTATNELWPQRLVPPTWGYGSDIDGRYLRFPHWFPVALSATFAAIPWIAWSRRFSIRAMLIGVTVVASLLGAMVYAVR